MASLIITVNDEGITSIEVLVRSVADGVKAGRLTERTALAVRLLQQSAKNYSEKTDEQASTEPPIDFLSSAKGVFLFRCACGARFVGAWDVARYEAMTHVKLRHADVQMRKDLDVMESITEALIVPNPLRSWPAFSEKALANINNARAGQGLPPLTLKEALDLGDDVWPESKE